MLAIFCRTGLVFVDSRKGKILSYRNMAVELVDGMPRHSL